MNRTRAIVAVAAILIVAGVVLGVDFWQRSRSAALDAVGIPIYVDGRLADKFIPADLEEMATVRFVDAEEGKTQEGWMLRDVLRLRLDGSRLQPETVIVVSSSSRNRSAELTWAEVDDPANMVMFDLSGRGTLKLVSTLERLDVRDEWVQDVDKIEVRRP
ncbi:MAG: hypothetical protein ACK2VD_13900 [Anaerolineae bacterium]|jgi:hypothetical protein